MYLYGVFLFNQRNTKWAMGRNKSKAITLAKKHPESEVRRLEDYPGSPSSYDAPTFRVLSERIWPT